ncbi:glycosyltransferase family 39 protein [bacterium]|nr:glycosyltransferase family 39 protein [bacterium]MCK4597201.1 glycosyltransferase family 39 protein [bacterium]
MEKPVKRGYAGKKSVNTESSQHRLFWHSIMVLAVGIGIYVRMKGLGKWPLAVDEYYIAKSVENILEHGVPRYECGGYYVRGILYQYLVAPFLLFGSNAEFSLRIIPVFSNLLSIPAIYWFGKKLSGVVVACLSVAFFCFSIWEIEFARFARMYAPFQTVFLWYLVFFYRVFVENEEQSTKWLYLLSFLSIFIHEGGIFLTALTFLLVLCKNRKRRQKNVLISLAILVFAFIYLHIDFRHLGTMTYLPEGVSLSYVRTSDNLSPFILFQTMSSNTVWIILSVIPISLALYAVYKVMKSKVSNVIPKLCFCTLIFLSLFNLYGLVIALLVVFLLSNNISSIKKYLFKYCMIIIGINFLFWMVYGLTTSKWELFLENTQSSPFGKLLVILFDYPDVFEKIIYTWLQAIPISTFMACAFILFGVVEAFTKPLEDRLCYRFLCLIVAISCLFVSVVQTPYQTTRYTFFLYPVVILLVMGSISKFSLIIAGNTKNTKMFLILLFSIIFFIFSEDFNIYHMRKIDSKEVNFRMVYNRDRSVHYYPRLDYRTPARLINENIDDGQIVISTVTCPDFYLNRLDYFYMDSRNEGFLRSVACSDIRDVWTNSKLIYEEDALWDIVDNQPTVVWLITQSINNKYWLQKISEKIFHKYHNYRFGCGVDGMIEVYKIGSSSESVPKNRF